MVDNAGSLAIWRKGYSTSCALSSVLVRALYEVSCALNCRVDIAKVQRCSDNGSIMADALSKAEFLKFQEVATSTGIIMTERGFPVPEALLQWVNNPENNWQLGRQIIDSISIGSATLFSV